MLDPGVLSNLVLILTGFTAAFVAALWLSLIFWTYRDIRQRTRDPLVHILATLVAAVLFLPGVLIYLILRPSHTLEEDYQRSLEEEALLQTIEETPQCPGCGRKVAQDWLVCPSCYTRLRKRCHQCGRLMELAWNICPYCGTAVPGARRENVTLDEALQASLVDEEPPSIESPS